MGGGGGGIDPPAPPPPPGYANSWQCQGSQFKDLVCLVVFLCLIKRFVLLSLCLKCKYMNKYFSSFQKSRGGGDDDPPRKIRGGGGATRPPRKIRGGATRPPSPRDRRLWLSVPPLHLKWKRLAILVFKYFIYPFHFSLLKLFHNTLSFLFTFAFSYPNNLKLKKEEEPGDN